MVPKYKIARLELFHIWQEISGSNATEKCHHVQNVLHNIFIKDNLSENYLKEIKQEINLFCAKLSAKWKQSHRRKEKFLKRNSDWLNHTFNFPSFGSIPHASTSFGRPQISFQESSDRTKRRKIQKLRNDNSSDVIISAAEVEIRSRGKKDAAKLMHEALHSSPTRPTKIRESWIQKKDKIQPYSPEEALLLLIETKLTKNQYIKLRMGAKLQNANIYPSYEKLRAAKIECYPNQDAINVTDSVIEVELQDLLDHTVSRLLKLQEDVINTINTKEAFELILISKWGCDGSSGHSEYKQKISDDIRDSDLFIISLVPLMLYSTSSKDMVIWKNPRPSSVRFCRPIKILYKKETASVAREEIHYIENKILSLKKTEILLNNKIIKVTHQMLLTMIDGKICNSITFNSSQCCYICDATPKEMNDINKIKTKNLNTENFKFGLSTLHAWIRFLECILHIAYRLDFKTWQAKKVNQEKLKTRKLMIQKQFKDEMGLVIDRVQPGGSGTSNDGNTARRFFKNYEHSARITHINEELIRRFGVILQAMASGYDINVDMFDAYCHDTVKLYLKHYSWFYMPTSVHKILLHGSVVISKAILPIGQLSEEAQEARNKDLKLFRRNFSRKISRESTNEDILHMLLVSSDPFLSGLRQLPHKKRDSFSSEVLHLLKEPQYNRPHAITTDDSESEWSTENDGD